MMDSQFTAILKKLVTERGKDAFLNAGKCKALLADYTQGRYAKESRWILQGTQG